MTPGTKHASFDRVLESVKFSKLILPILLGIGAVVWIMSRQLDLDELALVKWDFRSLFWILAALGLYMIRHLFYSWRLWVMTDRSFSFMKCMQLIVIWEFSSAVSPTNVGGTGVAVVLLAQEKLSGAKTVAVVVYSLVLDTILFVVTLPLFYLLFGTVVIRPLTASGATQGFEFTFLLVILAMMAYGSLFFYGLFINPNSSKRFLLFISRWRILARFRNNIRQTALDIVTAANEIKFKPFNFHLQAMTATAGAWGTRFLAVNCIILALVASTPLYWWDQIIIMIRGMSMFAITSFSPTPGGSGLAEFLFGGFYADYVPKGIASVIALIWRLITYYPYLILGAIVIPVWIRGIISKHSKTEEK